MAGNHSSVFRPKVLLALWTEPPPRPMRKLRAPPRGVIALWAGLQNPEPPILAGSLENRPLLSPGSTLEELRAPPPTSAAGLCLFDAKTPSANTKSQTLLFFFWHKCWDVIDILTQIQNNVSFLSEVANLMSEFCQCRSSSEA